MFAGAGEYARHETETIYSPFLKENRFYHPHPPGVNGTPPRIGFCNDFLTPVHFHMQITILQPGRYRPPPPSIVKHI